MPDLIKTRNIASFLQIIESKRGKLEHQQSQPTAPTTTIAAQVHCHDRPASAMARCHTPLGGYGGGGYDPTDYYAKPNPRAATLGRGLSVDQAEYARVTSSATMRKPPPVAPSRISPVKQLSCDYATVGAAASRGGGGGLTASSSSMVRPDYGGSNDYLEASSPCMTTSMMTTYDFPSSSQPVRETIERYIAVPISSTDHLLISSTGTGQHYLAEPVSALLTGSIRERLLDRMQQQQAGLPPPLPDRRGGGASMMRSKSPAPSLYSPTYDRPPAPLPAPGYERPPPLGANSRAASKLSLDNCSEKETEF
jgi:hypothetical protein